MPMGLGPVASLGLLADVQYADKPDGAHTRVWPHEIRRYRLALTKLGAAVSALAGGSTTLSCCLHLGDLIDGSPSAEATQTDLDAVLSQFERLSVPVLHVLGNKDMELPGGRAEIVARLPAVPPCVCASRDTPAQGYYYEHSLVAGWSLIVLDTTEVSLHGATGEMVAQATAFLELRQQPQAIRANGGTSQRQLAWLEHSLAVARQEGRRVLVAGHMPLLTAASRPGGYTRAFNCDALAALLDNYSDVVAVYLAGHYHRGGYSLSRGGVHHVTIEGMVEEGGHATLEIYTDRLEIKGSGGTTSRSLPLRRSMARYAAL